MGDRPIDRTKDPYYANLLYRIESAISETDKDAQSKQVQLTDSSVKSVLNKARKQLRGKKPEISRKSPKDEILADLFNTLLSLRKAFTIQEFYGATVVDDSGNPIEDGFIKINKSDWIKALETVEYSINIRRSELPGTRYYLDFIHGFIEETRSRIVSRG